MDALQLIGSLGKVYKRFPVPQNLQLHMMRVAGVGEIICDNWKGPRISKNDITAALLVHDLGNIIKFDLSQRGRGLIEDKRGIEYWVRAQNEAISKYGSSEYEATYKMMEELGVDARLRFLVEKMGDFLDSERLILGSHDWDLKIVAYADGRVSPQGITSLKERFDDLITRRKSKPVVEAYRRVFPLTVELERQIFRNTLITPEQITEGSVEPYVLKYKQKLGSK